MIILTNKLLFLNYKRIWFANTIPEYKNTDFISLRQFSGKKPEDWDEKKFITLFSDLTETENELLQKINKNVKYEIRRAEREQIITENGTIELFFNFFNEFAKSKNLKKLSKININAIKKYSIVTQAKLNENIIAMHLYLFDKDDSRVRLLYSATVNRNKTNIDLKLISMGNKLLHWSDMKLFKSKGFKIYDWGGIADNPNNIETLGIDKFKKSFGGIEVIENHYESPNLSKLKKMLRK